jgi:hypothetical protein
MQKNKKAKYFTVSILFTSNVIEILASYALTH